jgi:SsrA-binding protein
MKPKVENNIEKVLIANRKARFEYHIEETFRAGISLTGTEVKSIRAGKANFLDAYAFEAQGEVSLKNMFIQAYENGTYNNHEPNRTRRLLLNKKEIAKIRKKLDEKGFTLVPLALYLNQNGLMKVELGLAKGKKLHDKRDDIKERDTKREVDRSLKND